MGNQRKLTALLHELQHARSPLAQARILARAWRTLRELSPTDRRLLARQVGFDGAEEMLEGLSRRKGGLAPAMLLRALANARSTDESELVEILSAYRDPKRLDEAVSRSAELASELLAEPDIPEPPEEPDEALGELQAVQESSTETPEEGLTAPNAMDPDLEAAVGAGSESADSEEVEIEAEAEPQTEAEAEPQEAAPPPPPPEPVVDWSRWEAAAPSSRPAPQPRPEPPPPAAEVASRPFEARKILGAMGAEPTVLSRLQVLRRELAAFSGSSAETIRDLVESFPDGWARRRAVCALIEAGEPSEIRDAIRLVALLGRESDRRWCLGVLARRGGLVGKELDSALDLVSSPVSKRRIRTAARSA